MSDWLITALVLIIGFTVMVTGLIQWVYIGFMVHLLIMVGLGILGRIWLYFENRNNK